MQSAAATTARDYSAFEIFDHMSPEEIADWFRRVRANAHAQVMKELRQKRPARRSVHHAR